MFPRSRFAANSGYVSSLGRDPLDPASEHFLGQFAQRSSVQRINLRLLTAYQRALLVLDGTVTNFIEAWTMDPINIICLGQAVQVLSERHAELGAASGERVLARSVILEGRYSRHFHAHAISLIALGRLPEQLRRALEKEEAGIGQILRANELETRREILWFGREQLADLPAGVRSRWPGEFIVRTYRIHADGYPIMLISERFPFPKAGPRIDD
jgi:chorismate-pyruvate lyase